MSVYAPTVLSVFRGEMPGEDFTATELSNRTGLSREIVEEAVAHLVAAGRLEQTDARGFWRMADPVA